MSTTLRFPTYAINALMAALEGNSQVRQMVAERANLPPETPLAVIVTSYPVGRTESGLVEIYICSSEEKELNRTTAIRELWRLQILAVSTAEDVVARDIQRESDFYILLSAANKIERAALALERKTSEKQTIILHLQEAQDIIGDCASAIDLLHDLNNAIGFIRRKF